MKLVLALRILHTVLVERCAFVENFGSTCQLVKFYKFVQFCRTQMLDIVPLADSVLKLQARCAFCDRGALFSLRVTADERKEVVGGSDVYRPVCRR